MLFSFIFSYLEIFFVVFFLSGNNGKVQAIGDETRYPIREQELLAIVLALKQWFHLLRGPQQVHVHTDHESL